MRVMARAFLTLLALASRSNWIFLLAGRHDLQRPVWNRPLQRLGVVPRACSQAPCSTDEGYLLEGAPLKADIAAKETEATRLADAGNSDRAHALLSDFYGKVPFGTSLGSSLLSMAQCGRKVKLYHKDPSAYGPYAAPINKLLLAFCQRYFPKDVDVAPGGLDLTDPASPKITDASGSKAVDKDTLLIRMGADAGALKMLNVRQKEALVRNASALSPLCPQSWPMSTTRTYTSLRP
jgi:hypothetical protein